MTDYKFLHWISLSLYVMFAWVRFSTSPMSSRSLVSCTRCCRATSRWCRCTTCESPAPHAPWRRGGRKTWCWWIRLKCNRLGTWENDSALTFTLRLNWIEVLGARYHRKHCEYMYKTTSKRLKIVDWLVVGGWTLKQCGWRSVGFAVTCSFPSEILVVQIVVRV